MNILKIAFKELIGLFIDDGALALLSLMLVMAIGYATRAGMINGTLGAVVVFVGCLIILGESVTRAARRKFSKK